MYSSLRLNFLPKIPCNLLSFGYGGKSSRISRNEAIHKHVVQHMKRIVILTLIGISIYGCGKKYGEISDEFKNPGKLIVETETDTVTTSNNELIARFINSIENGYGIKPHKCEYNFKIHLVNSENENMTFYITKGHSSKYYEFGINQKAYEIDKTEFLEIFKSLNLNLNE